MDNIKIKEQLTKAFQLMKDGEKGQALFIVKGILREDSRNVNAWWMMSHLLEDEDKVVKSLEKVLSLDPNHQIARKKLAKLRPEYSNLVSNTTIVAKSAKNASPQTQEYDESYWNKLSRPAKHKGNKWERAVKDGAKARLELLGVAAVIFVIVFLVFGVVSIFTGFPDIDAPISEPSIDINGNTPQDALQTFVNANFIQDADVLYMITCPAIHNETQRLVTEFNEYYPAGSVDFTETVFEIKHYDYRNDRAYVTMSGITSYSGGGVTTAINWNDAAQSEGFDFYGEFVHNIDGQWLVCTEYNVPNVINE